MPSFRTSKGGKKRGQKPQKNYSLKSEIGAVMVLEVAFGSLLYHSKGSKTLDFTGF